jgi:hypothetical protein
MLGVDADAHEGLQWRMQRFRAERPEHGDGHMLAPAGHLDLDVVVRGRDEQGRGVALGLRRHHAVAGEEKTAFEHADLRPAWRLPGHRRVGADLSAGRHRRSPGWC